MVDTMKRYKITTFLKKIIKDNEGEAVKKACNRLGQGEITDVRMGKCIFIVCEDDTDINALCDKMLVNPVMEDYTIEPGLEEGKYHRINEFKHGWMPMDRSEW